MPTPLQTLHQQGYILLPSLIPPSTLQKLRTAATNITTLSRTGAWPHVRTVGKQFPPWDSTLVASGQTGIWGVQHLLHPDLPVSEEDRGEFVKVYFGREVLGVVEGLVGGEEGGMVMELMNMLVRPDGEGFELAWHRDDVPASATEEEERERLRPKGGGEEGWYGHAQWNLALWDDDALIVVPGSHARPRTEAERAAGPYQDPLEGQVRVALKAGDVVFYDNNILHRGVYDAGKERMTLHGSVGHVRGSAERARNVLQHGVGEYVDRCDFSALGEGVEREVAEGMRRRLVELGRENQGRDIGYSLEG